MFNPLVLIGAYGRDATAEDWFDGLDFKICGGPYTSIRDQEKILKEWSHIILVNWNGDHVLTIQ